MQGSKNIFERVRLYKINFERVKLYKNINNSYDKNINKNNTKLPTIQKQSKIKIFFKFFIGFIFSFFEYLAMKSNKKKSIKNTVPLKNTTKISTSNELNKVEYSQNKTKPVENSIKNNNIPPFHIEKININMLDNYNNINTKIEKNNKVLTKKIDNCKSEFVKNQKAELHQTKKNLLLIEDQIIYANTCEELEIAKTKILKTKQELQLKKSENLVAVKSLEEDKKQVTKNNDTNSIQKEIAKKVIGPLTVSEENTFELKKENETLITQKNFEDQQDIIDNNIEIDKLTERCNEDLILVEEKKEYINLQEEYEEHLNEVENDSKNFKLTKKDLRQIKNNVSNILDRQKYNLEQLNRYMNMQTDSKMFMAKVNNFFKSTAKLSFSVIPLFLFPNKLLGLTTSAIMFNNSLKSYRMQPNSNYINQNIKMMVSNNQLCLRVGISESKSALNEIDNIKYYLNNLPSEAKDTLEYRKYLVDVYSTEKIVKKQIETLQKMSKNYENIKVKVKRKYY